MKMTVIYLQLKNIYVIKVRYIKGEIMDIQVKADEEFMELIIDGRIDSNTSAQLQESILEALDSSQQVILNLGQVSYISSAGLRSILMGQKTASAKRGSFKLSNVDPLVMEVFQTVGFDKILTFK